MTVVMGGDVSRVRWKLAGTFASAAYSFSLVTASVNSFEASMPFAAWPVTLIVKFPNAASDKALSVTWVSSSPCLMTGAAGSSVTPVGSSPNCSATSWSKVLSRLMPIATVFVSPCL